MPRLYGGDVITRSTLASAIRDIPVMQSCLRRSNLVTAATCIGMRFVQPESKARISGEHRLPACPFRQPAEKLFDLSRSFPQRFGVVGKLPTTTGQRPVLPRNRHSQAFVNSLIFSHG